MLNKPDQGLFRKIRLYLFGVVLGGIISYFMFIKDRDLSYWTPERQVTGRLKMYAYTYTDKSKCQMQCNNITETVLKSAMDSASVDFKNSETQRKPCPVYSVHTRNGINVRAELCDDSTAHIIELRGTIFEDDTCQCQ
ncbi:MAG: DUF4258 domain-containing protein [Bacteroidia bacterium]|nr:DUF4258 domain-containing protein [Bacteroidia bacterium]